MARLREIVVLLRPVNVLLTWLVVFVMIIFMSGSQFVLHTAFFAAAAAAITAAAGNIINDLTDIGTDRNNHPRRPLVTGTLTTQFASRLYIYLVILSIGISLLLPGYLCFFVAAVHVLLYLYSVKLQYIILAGNILIALLTGSAFVYAGIAAGNIGLSLIPALFGFLINLMREIVKDIEDMTGDRALGAVTFPLRYGAASARYLIVFLGILLVLSTWVPFIAYPQGVYFSVCANLFVNPLIVQAVVYLFNGRNNSIRKAGNMLKYAMLLGLGAIGLWI